MFLRFGKNSRAQLLFIEAPACSAPKSGPVAWWERRWVGGGALEDTVTQMTELE